MQAIEKNIFLKTQYKNYIQKTENESKVFIYKV